MEFIIRPKIRPQIQDEKFKEHENGTYALIVASNKKVTRIIPTAPFLRDEMSTTYGIKVTDCDPPKYIDVLEVLEAEKISLPFLKTAKFNIFYGKIEGDTFITDVTMLYQGRA